MKAIIISFICLFTASCGIYKTTFDCPPGEGIGCKPVSEVLDMIVEKESEGDLFIKDTEVALLLKNQEKRKKKRKANPARTKEIQKLYLLKEHEKESVLVEEGPQGASIQ